MKIGKVFRFYRSMDFFPGFVHRLFMFITICRVLLWYYLKAFHFFIVFWLIKVWGRIFFLFSTSHFLSLFLSLPFARVYVLVGGIIYSSGKKLFIIFFHCFSSLLKGTEIYKLQSFLFFLFSTLMLLLFQVKKIMRTFWNLEQK